MSISTPYFPPRPASQIIFDIRNMENDELEKLFKSLAHGEAVLPFAVGYRVLGLQDIEMLLEVAEAAIKREPLVRNLIERLRKRAETLSAKLERMTPKARNVARDAEVIRLKKEDSTRTSGQIAKLICQKPDWAKTESGKVFNASTVRGILRRARTLG